MTFYQMILGIIIIIPVNLGHDCIPNITEPTRVVDHCSGGLKTGTNSPWKSCTPYLEDPRTCKYS